MPAVDGATASRRATYSALTGVFLGVFALVSRRKPADGKEFRLGPFDLLQLGLASYRMGRMISYDKVFETYRSPVTETVPDASGFGETVEAKGQGVQQALGDLICCPICVGTWAAAFLVYGLRLAPRPTRMMLAIMSSVGLAEFVNAATEYLQWTGQIARERSGSERLAKAKK